jgi:hypothetical protein
MVATQIRILTPVLSATFCWPGLREHVSVFCYIGLCIPAKGMYCLAAAWKGSVSGGRVLDHHKDPNGHDTKTCRFGLSPYFQNENGTFFATVSSQPGEPYLATKYPGFRYVLEQRPDLNR